MSECIGRYYIENGVLTDSSEFNPNKVWEGEVLYEVLRVIDGVPLFYEDHMSRMDESLYLSRHQPLATEVAIREHIKLLVRKNSILDGNIKITFHYNGNGAKYMVYFIESQYPDESMYKSGVDTILFDAERKNPGAKIFNFRLRSSILDSLVRKAAYEALLVNREGCITEGSRSNIYFIRNNRIITAGDDFVLGGITRKYIKQVCRSENIEVEYRCLKVEELDSVDSVFLSGTSPHVLPVKSIGLIQFRVDHPLLKTVYDSYCHLVKSYVEARR